MDLKHKHNKTNCDIQAEVYVVDMKNDMQAGDAMDETCHPFSKAGSPR